MTFSIANTVTVAVQVNIRATGAHVLELVRALTFYCETQSKLLLHAVLSKPELRDLAERHVPMR